MGRRSRQREAAGRDAAPEAPRPAPEPPRTPRRRATMDEAPKAPWHPVPLVELSIFAGLVLVVVGFVVKGATGGILVTGGIVLVSVAALELTLREHFTGYRSHTGLLAAAAAVAVLTVATIAHAPHVVALLLGVAVGGVAFVALRRTFQRKAGGLTWRA